MKQINITPEILNRIKSAVGDDVDPTGFAVFESIALNTLPLPGKGGTIFERAIVSELTLAQMAESINGGNSLPVIWSHDNDDIPKGKVFYAETTLGESGESELRTLFYIDPTEEKIISKLNAASIDEVSVSFLASQILCSECGFDYRGEHSSDINLILRECDDGHKIGEKGVHARLTGLSVFTELSLVSRGAAKDPKIVGKSKSKLAAPLQQLAAKGMQVDKLYLAASRGESKVDIEKLVTQLSDSKAEAITLKAAKDASDLEVTTLKASNTELSEQVANLTAELETAKAESKATELEAATAELSEAKTILGNIFTKLATANGETEISVPESITELKAGIESRQSKLTAILPVGGVSTDTNKKAETGSKFRADQKAAFMATR